MIDNRLSSNNYLIFQYVKELSYSRFIVISDFKSLTNNLVDNPDAIQLIPKIIISLKELLLWRITDSNR